MAIDLTLKESATREQRLGSITGYDGKLSDLTKQGCAGCLLNKGRRFQTVSSCSHTHTINQLSGLTGALVVDHGPIGCSGGQIFFTLNRNRLNPPPGVPPLEHSKIISTNLDESDTIFGAVEKLRQTVLAAYERHHPKEIFIVSSCVSAIIGDDIFSVAQELNEELDIPVIAAAGEGLRSKIWATGFDSYSHAVSKARFSPPTGERNPIINYSGFGPVGRQYVEPFFTRLGLQLNLLVGGSTQEDFHRATTAIASWGQCSSQSNYILSVLEQEYGVRYLQSHLPYGGIGFERFMRDLGKLIGKEDIVEEIIAEEKEKYKDQIDAIKARLKGKRAFIALGSGFAYEYSRLLWELGVEVQHAIGYHFDPVLDQNNLESEIAAATDVKELKLDFDTSINDGQEMETYLLVKEYNPDFLVSRGHEASAWSMLQGIPSLDTEIGFVIMGYRGLVEFGTTIVEVLDSKNFVEKLGARYVSPFTEAYEGLSPFSFYDEEAAI
ncbi:MAG: oxidoreductase [Clostridiales Family XIII bacterium]|jgi:nitrogenase molybdenum-iron protein alpha chain|nr:oxidoreductase [Clostridiales Family XIII bacterium]